MPLLLVCTLKKITVVAEGIEWTKEMGEMDISSALSGIFLNGVPLAPLQEASFGFHSRGWPESQELLRNPAWNAAHWLCEEHQGLRCVCPVPLRP